MKEVGQSLIPFLAILNPFALCLYLLAIMAELDLARFVRVLTGACLIALVGFSICAVAGEAVLVEGLGVRPEAMRIFGGIIFFIVAYNYVVRGYKGAEVLRGSMEELPSAIALPFMIGAGTITQAMWIGKRHTHVGAVGILALGVAVTFAVVLGFKVVRDRMTGPRERLFERYINILARLNGLIIGAISTEMVVGGLHDLWQGVS